MIKKSGRSIGRRIIMSSKAMNLLPWGGVIITVIGLISVVLGIMTIFKSGLILCGTAVSVIGLGVLLCGIALFIAMCIVQDITGMF